MPDIVVTFETTPKTVLESYRACHRQTHMAHCVLLCTGMLTGVWILICGIILASIPFALLAAVVMAYAVLRSAAFKRSIRKQLHPYLQGPHTVTVTITEHEYRVVGPTRETSRPLTEFTRVHRSGDFWVLRLSKRAALSLPVAALDTAKTAAFLELMGAKGLVKD